MFIKNLTDLIRHDKEFDGPFLTVPLSEARRKVLRLRESNYVIWIHSLKKLTLSLESDGRVRSNLQNGPRIFH